MRSPPRSCFTGASGIVCPSRFTSTLRYLFRLAGQEYTQGPIPANKRRILRASSNLMFVNGAGGLFVADKNNSRVVKLPAGTLNDLLKMVRGSNASPPAWPKQEEEAGGRGLELLTGSGRDRVPSIESMHSAHRLLAGTHEHCFGIGPRNPRPDHRRQSRRRCRPASADYRAPAAICRRAR